METITLQEMEKLQKVFKQTVFGPEYIVNYSTENLLYLKEMGYGVSSHHIDISSVLSLFSNCKSIEIHPVRKFIFHGYRQPKYLFKIEKYCNCGQKFNSIMALKELIYYCPKCQR